MCLPVSSSCVSRRGQKGWRRPEGDAGPRPQHCGSGFLLRKGCRNNLRGRWVSVSFYCGRTYRKQQLSGLRTKFGTSFRLFALASVAGQACFYFCHRNIFINNWHNSSMWLMQFCLYWKDIIFHDFENGTWPFGEEAGRVTPNTIKNTPWTIKAKEIFL